MPSVSGQYTTMSPQDEMLFLLREILLAVSHDVDERVQKSCECPPGNHHPDCDVGVAEEWMERVGRYFGWTEKGAQE